jgi:hypothetical protein
MENQPQNSNWCWAAVGVSVNRYFAPDSNLSLRDLVETILNDPGACHRSSGLDQPAHLERVLRHLKVLKEPPRAGALSFNDIRAQINAGLPVCVRVEWPDLNSGHFVIIRGYAVTASGERWVDVADPAFGNSTVPYDDFVNSYQGAGQWDYTFLVQPPPKEQ